jgi:MFS family permease
LAERSWTSPATFGCVVAGLALLVAFVAVERRAPHPLLPLRVVTDRTRAAAFAVQGLVGAVGLGAMVFLAFHLQVVMGLSPMQAGTGTLPFTVALMAAVPFAVRMVDRVGPRRQMVIGPLISAAGLVLLSRVTADGGYWMQVLPGLVLMGAGMGFTVVPLNNLALSGVAPHDAGVASATANATNQLGGSIGLAGLTALYVVAAARAGGGVEGVVAGHGAVFLAGAGLYVAASVVAAVLLRPGVPGVEGQTRPEPTAVPVTAPVK